VPAASRKFGEMSTSVGLVNSPDSGLHTSISPGPTAGARRLLAMQVRDAHLRATTSRPSAVKV